MHPYIEHKVFRGEHSDSVNSVSFSPCGKYLASASSDCSACIWKTSCGSFLFRVVFQSPVNALLWHPAREGTLICGCEDGTVLSMSNFTPDGYQGKHIRLGVTAPIFCMDIEAQAKLLAIGIRQQVCICKDNSNEGHTAVTRLPLPPPIVTANTDQNDRHIRPRSAHFIKNGKVLIVCYLNHGIVGWDISAKSVVWHVKQPNVPQIGSSSICSKLNVLVVNTLQDGLFLYKLGGRTAIRRWSVVEDAEARRPLSVSLLHGGKAIVSGTNTGSVAIWNASSKDLYQVLPHSSDVIQAVAAHQQGPWSYIAVGSALKGEDTYVKVWKAHIGLEPSPSSDQLGTLCNRLMVVRFSMEWSDYGRVALAVAFVMICAAVTVALLEFLWLNVPWESIRSSLSTLIHGVAVSLWLFTRWSFSEARQVAVVARRFVRATVLSFLGSLKSAIRAFLELPPVDTPTANHMFENINHH